MRKMLYTLFITFLLLSACSADKSADKEEEIIRTMAQYFEEVDNRFFEVAYPVRIEDEDYYKVTVSGVLDNGKKDLIDVFAVNPDCSKRFFYNSDTDQFEQFHTSPLYACKTSPDGRWRIESVGMHLDGPSGLHALLEMRIVDLSTGNTEWSDASYLLNHFIWSDDSRFVAAQNSGRQWIATRVIDTNDFSVISLPGIDDVIKAYTEVGKPDENNPMPMFKALRWLDQRIINIDLEWSVASGMVVVGEYTYDVIDKTMHVLSINEEQRG